jgi:hypothetical protein
LGNVHFLYTLSNGAVNNYGGIEATIKNAIKDLFLTVLILDYELLRFSFPLIKFHNYVKLFVYLYIPTVKKKRG